MIKIYDVAWIDGFHDFTDVDVDAIYVVVHEFTVVHIFVIIVKTLENTYETTYK